MAGRSGEVHTNPRISVGLSCPPWKECTASRHPQVQCASRDLDTPSRREWRRAGCPGPWAGPSAGRGRQLVLTQTFPSLASGPSGSLKAAAPLGGRPLALPGMTPGLCVAWGGVPRRGRGVPMAGRGVRPSGRKHPLPCPLGPNLVSFPRPATWSLVPSSLGAEPDWSLGPQSLLLHAPTWNLLRVLEIGRAHV